jgi:hypothetical protein
MHDIAVYCPQAAQVFGISIRPVGRKRVTNTSNGTGVAFAAPARVDRCPSDRAALYRRRLIRRAGRGR